MIKLETIKAPFSSGWNHIDALLDTGPGWNWLTPVRTVLYYSFSVTEGTDPKSSGVTGTLSSFNLAQQNAVRDILKSINQITGISFAEVSDGKKADLHFANANITNANNAGLTQWTFNYSYDASQTITTYLAQAYVYVDNAESGTRYLSPVAGNYAYELLMHEIGHAMGLKHPFEGGVVLPSAEDNTDFSLMSYTQKDIHSVYGAYDIAALKWLYGGDGLGGNLGVGSQGKYLLATSNDDVIQASLGNDVIDGQLGKDTLRYSGNRSQYVLTPSADGLAVVGKEGKDTVLNIEEIRFSDMHVNLLVQSYAKTLSTSDVSRIEELYLAFFNRVPDSDGLAYWLTQFKSGASLAQISDAFYGAGISFSSITGYTKDMSDQAFVNLVYKNVLGRSEGADTEGLIYWTTALAAGRETHGSLVNTILNSAHSFKGDIQFGWVADLLDNKIAVAHSFAVRAGLSYNTDADSISSGMKIAAAVTSSGIDAALKLIGINADQFNLA